MKIDWKRKLTSRKFWLAVIGFVTALLAGFGLKDNDIAQITSIISSAAVVIAYIIGEGMTDAANAEVKDTNLAPAFYYPAETLKTEPEDNE